MSDNNINDPGPVKRLSGDEIIYFHYPAGQTPAYKRKNQGATQIQDSEGGPGTGPSAAGYGRGQSQFAVPDEERYIALAPYDRTPRDGSYGGLGGLGNTGRLTPVNTQTGTGRLPPFSPRTGSLTPFSVPYGNTAPTTGSVYQDAPEYPFPSITETPRSSSYNSSGPDQTPSAGSQPGAEGVNEFAAFNFGFGVGQPIPPLSSNPISDAEAAQQYNDFDSEHDSPHGAIDEHGNIVGEAITAPGNLRIQLEHLPIHTAQPHPSPPAPTRAPPAPPVLEKAHTTTTIPVPKKRHSKLPIPKTRKPRFSGLPTLIQNNNNRYPTMLSMPQSDEKGKEKEKDKVNSKEKENHKPGNGAAASSTATRRSAVDLEREREKRVEKEGKEAETEMETVSEEEGMGFERFLGRMFARKRGYTVG